VTDENFEDLGDLIVRIMAILVLVGSMMAGCSYINRTFGLKNDNLIESSIEDMIESQVGIEIDLTPEDPDDDDYSLDIWAED